MSQYLIKSPTLQQQSGENMEYHVRAQRRVYDILETPLVKMSYNDYLIKKNSSIISVNLPDNSKTKQYQQLFKNRTKYEGQISNFFNQDKTNGGSYYFYSWISNDDFCCDIPTEGVSLLATLIFSYQYERAKQLIQQWPKNIVTSSLSMFFKGFVNIIRIVQNDPDLKKIFFNRQKIIKDLLNIQPSEIKSTKLLLIDKFQSLDGILQCYSTLDQKKHCILANLNYLKKFIGSFPSYQINDYYRLIFAFMANTEDQLQSKNMYLLLLNCRQLNLLDRLNFAQKLLPLEIRKQFISQFSKKIVSLTHLSNLLFFSSKDHHMLDIIICNYLDQYGDLQSVASIALQYAIPQLNKFIDMYQEVLILSCQEKKARTLENLQIKKLGPYCLKKQKSQISHKLFLNQIDIMAQKLEPIKKIKQQPPSKHEVCYVCFRYNQPNQGLFVQCGKCKHGGHLNHLLKWYQQSNNVCPKTDCPCYCV